MNTSQREATQLGMPYGTAMNRLRKELLFSLLQRLGEDVCYRCGKRILLIRELSIEHKEAWLDVNPELFWDIDNVTFSHLGCNSGASRKLPKQPIPHGTHTGYSHHGCRCVVCREAHSKYMKSWKQLHKGL